MASKIGCFPFPPPGGPRPEVSGRVHDAAAGTGPGPPAAGRPPRLGGVTRADPAGSHTAAAAALGTCHSGQRLPARVGAVRRPPVVMVPRFRARPLTSPGAPSPLAAAGHPGGPVSQQHLGARSSPLPAPGTPAAEANACARDAPPHPAPTPIPGRAHVLHTATTAAAYAHTGQGQVPSKLAHTPIQGSTAGRQGLAAAPRGVGPPPPPCRDA